MANEKRLIDADALREDWLTNGENEHIYDTNAFLDSIDEQPTVDAEEVVHSWWEKSASGYRICNHCKADVAIFSGHKNYCPNCGAKMDGGNEDDL